MLWRATLFVGVLLAVLLIAASIALDGVTHNHRSCIQYKYRTLANGFVTKKYCASYAYFHSQPHKTAGRYLRLSAAGVLVLTLAALPLMAGLSKRHSGAS